MKFNKPSDFGWLAIIIVATLLFLGFVAYLDRTDTPATFQAQSAESEIIQSSDVQITDGPPPFSENRIWGKFCDSGLLEQSPVITVGGSRVVCYTEAGTVEWEGHCDDGWTVSVWPGNWVACYFDPNPTLSLYPFSVSASDNEVKISRGDLEITIRAGE